MLRVEMLHQHEPQARVERQMLEQLRECLQPARRCANPYNGEPDNFPPFVPGCRTPCVPSPQFPDVRFGCRRSRRILLANFFFAILQFQHDFAGDAGKQLLRHGFANSAATRIIQYAPRPSLRKSFFRRRILLAGDSLATVRREKQNMTERLRRRVGAV